jgi:hypothetical protein
MERSFETQTLLHTWKSGSRDTVYDLENLIIKNGIKHQKGPPDILFNNRKYPKFAKNLRTPIRI